MASTLTRLLQAVTFASLSTVNLSAQDTRQDHFGLGQGRLRALCAAYRQGNDAMVRRERDLTKARSTEPPQAGDWRALGCVRALLYADDLDGPVRHPWSTGAFDAFSRALVEVPDDSLSAEAYAVLAFDLIGQGHPQLGVIAQSLNQLANLEYSAVRAGLHQPAALRACTEFNIDNGNLATARYCDAVALELNVDVTWHMIRESWLASIHDDSTSSTEYFDAAVRAAHDAESLGEVTWHMRWIVDSGWSAPGWLEAEWTGLSDSGRVSWLHHHLADAVQMAPPALSRRIPRGPPTHTAPPTQFAMLLAQAEAVPGFVSPMLEFCPFALERNGARVAPIEQPCTVTVHYVSGRLPTSSYVASPTIGIVSQLNQLWNVRTGKPMALLTYAINRGDLLFEQHGNRETAGVDLDIRQWEWQTGRWIDSVVQVEFSRAEGESRNARVVGAMLVEPPVGASSWTVGVSQPARYGQVTVDGRVGIDSMPVTLSDLIIGVASEGLTWPLGARQLVLAPWGTVRPHEPIELYYQIRSDATYLGSESRVSLRHIVNGRIEEKAALSLKFNTATPQGIGEVERELDISRIASSGDYQLSVEMLGADGKLLARRTTNLYVR